MPAGRRAYSAKGSQPALATALLGIGLWWVLAGNHGWPMAVAAVAAATAARCTLRPADSRLPRPLALCLFVPYFLRTSVVSGFDVMRRVLARRPAIDPVLLPYTSRLPAGTPQVFFANVISLLPGTLSVDLQDQQVVVHVIAAPEKARRGLAELETRVARLFGVQEGGR